MRGAGIAPGLAAVAALTGAACRAGQPAATPSATTAAPPPAPPALPTDTMVAQAAGGYQIWLAEGREARDSAGAPCYERSVEIRRGTAVTKVPLLFTTKAPTALGRSNLRAELMRNCRVVGVYRVDLATGRPTRIGQ